MNPVPLVLLCLSLSVCGVGGRPGVNSVEAINGRDLKRSTECGEFWQVIYEDQTAILTSPGWSQGQYQSYTYCNWTLQVTGQFNTNKTAQLKLVDSSIEYEASCNNDYLAVYDYDTDDLLGKFCGTSCDGTIINAPEARVRVVFYSNERYTDKGFQLQWSRIDRDPYTSCRCAGDGLCMTCGGRFDSNDGELTYPEPGPVIPVMYTSFARCSWSITVTEGMYTAFAIVHLDIEANPNCTLDALVIRKTGEDEDIARLCGTQCVGSFVGVTSHRSQVYFWSDESVQFTGFQLTYQTVPKGVLPNSVALCNCGGWEDGCSGLIAQYQPTVTSGPMPTIPTPPPIGPMTTTPTPPPIPTGCGGVYTELSGELLSPNYPQNYPNNARCEYHIVVPEGWFLMLTFVKFELEDHSTCAYDSLTIPYHGQLCSDQTGLTLIVPSNNITLLFTSDSVVGKDGFQILYEAVDNSTTPPPPTMPPLCGSVYTNLTGDIFSPNFPDEYPVNVRCLYNITVPEGYFLFISFLFFQLEGPEDDCRYDFFNILVPYYEERCGTQTGQILILQTNHFSAEFFSDNVVTRQGFHIEYHAFENGTSAPIDSSCGGNFTTAMGYIASPGFPIMYQADTRCFWNVIAPPGKVLTFLIDQLNLEAVVDCSFDSLIVREFDSDTNIGKFCGSAATGSRVHLNTGRSQVIFTSDKNIERMGFILYYTTVTSDSQPYSYVFCNCEFWYEGCSGQQPVYTGRPTPPPTAPPPISCDATFTNLTGNIYSPNYPGEYPYVASCQYNITVPEGYHIFFSLVDFNVEFQEDCVFDSLRILTPVSMRYCGILSGEAILIPSNIVTAVFTSDSSVASTGFHIEYQALEPGTTPPIDLGCGANFSDTTSGEITSPGFPDPYPNGARCVWLITVPESMGIRFTIHSFDLVPGCQDVISIRNGGYFTYYSTRQLCQGNIEPIFYSDNTNIVALVFNSLIGGNATGFNITYEAFDPNAPMHMPPNPEVPCGVVPLFTGLRPHIVGGQNAEPNAYPWQIYMLKFTRIHCGGNVVNESWILTAAHCVRDGDAAAYEVVAGVHNRGIFEIAIQRRTIDSIIIHPDFYYPTLDNDIALMHMAQPLRWTDYVRPICIATEMANVSTECVISGWGRTEAPPGNPDILQYAQVPILDTNECRQSYLDGGFFANNITDNMFCAGFYEGGKDTCAGDSGGPLACYLGDRYELVGLTSWGEGCADEFFPGIYTRVVNFLDFIANSTNGEVLPLP